MRTLVLPYKQNSKSAKTLAKEMKLKRVLRKSNRDLDCDVIINWGCCVFNMPNRYMNYNTIINHPESVRFAVYKIKTLEILTDEGVRTPKWTIVKDVAELWFKMKGDNHKVYCRTKTDGHSGEGIVVANHPDELVHAPLYTLGVNGNEYRIHVVGGKVIDRRQKVSRKEWDGERNPDIKSHKYGYIFKKNGIEVPPDVEQQALEAVDALELDFAAVDVLSDAEGYGYVIEVNTACGLTGSTPGLYAEALTELIKEIHV